MSIQLNTRLMLLVVFHYFGKTHYSDKKHDGIILIYNTVTLKNTKT